MMSRAEKLLANIGGKIGASAGPRQSTSATDDEYGSDPRRDGVRRAMGLHTVSVDRIAPDESQARTDYDEDSLRELGESILNNGQAQPIAVRWDNDKEIYVLIAGERRWRAAKLCGIESLRAEVKEGLTEEQIVELQTVENLSREDLNPIEQATAFRKYMDAKSLTGKDAAKQLGFSPTTVTRSLKLLDLPADLQAMVARGTLAVSVARDLPKIGDEDAMREAVAAISEEGMSRDQATEVVSIKSGSPKSKASTPKKTHKLKQFTASNGIQIVASGKRRHPQAEVLEALNELLATMKKDGRIKSAA